MFRKWRAVCGVQERLLAAGFCAVVTGIYNDLDRCNVKVTPPHSSNKLKAAEDNSSAAADLGLTCNQHCLLSHHFDNHCQVAARLANAVCVAVTADIMVSLQCSNTTLSFELLERVLAGPHNIETGAKGSFPGKHVLVLTYVSADAVFKH